jgi:hypothetical protein
MTYVVFILQAMVHRERQMQLDWEKAASYNVCGINMLVINNNTGGHSQQTNSGGVRMWR